VSVVDRIRDFEILSHLSPAQSAALAECITPLDFAVDERVLEEGEHSREAYLIDRGQVRIQRDTPYGHYTLADLAAGSFFGETSFIDEHGRSGDVVVLEAATLLPFNPLALEDAFQADRRLRIALHWAFWKSLSQKLRQTNQMLADFFSGADDTPKTVAFDPRQSGEFHIGISAKRKLFREQKLSTMEINFLSSLSEEKSYDAGQEIFREGERGDSLYVVLDGRVMISKIISGAGEEALAILERGAYFGEMALIDSEPRSANAKAHEGGAVVLKIPRDVLSGILDIQKVSSFRLLNLLCGLVAKRLREVDDKLVGWHIFSSGSGQSLEIPSTS